MIKENFEKIVDFIEEEIGSYDIEFKFEIEDDTLIAKFSGSFASQREAEMFFVCEDNEVMFYCLSESYTEATTRSFWIDFMTRIYEE